MSNELITNNRVLVIDDNRAIHDDFRKILGGNSARQGLASIESALFGDAAPDEAAAAAVSMARLPMRIDGATQGEEGLALVKNAREQGDPYAVAFVDMRMPPGWDGLRTVREIWKVDPNLNIVICTAFSDQSWGEIESTAGDGDRLLVLKKPFEPIEVRRLAATLSAKWTLAARADLRMSELEELVRQRTTELRHAATHDRLTGLPNRRLFLDRLTQAFDLSRRRPEFRLAVLFVDFDRFKWVNDSLGHEAGDVLLKAIGSRLNGALRCTDSVTNDAGLDARADTHVAGRDNANLDGRLDHLEDAGEKAMTARLGGDEFCVLLTGLASDGHSALVADRILKELAKPYQIFGREIHSTASIGVAAGTEDYERAEDMVRDADTAMYCAKANGKGRFVIFNKTMHEQAMHRLTIQSELRRAVDEGELRPYFQPIVRLDTGEMTGAEALVRWHHPQRGMIMPGEFISIAEESGFIHELGLAVLEATCRQMRAWKRDIPGLALSVSVNVSSIQLTARDFFSRVESILAAAEMDPKFLILEITESALVGATETTSRNLREIREKGIRIYLDDFGTGYSSLNMLNQFRLDGLKIDRSFVRQAGGFRQYAAIIQAINDLAHNLGIAVVAEGVETPDELALLQTLDCGNGQGYLFSRPICASDFETLIRDRNILLAKFQTKAA
jgi:predicted signal transduction protein with EAL and GGDEF domain